MAQDFYAAFKVGEDDRHITSIDEDGVALAAIKALHAENGALRSDNKALHGENAVLRRRPGDRYNQRQDDPAASARRPVDRLPFGPDVSRHARGGQPDAGNLDDLDASGRIRTVQRGAQLTDGPK
jgi:hypothetical protein